jgi:hypothetical protein
MPRIFLLSRGQFAYVYVGIRLHDAQADVLAAHGFTYLTKKRQQVKTPCR